MWHGFPSAASQLRAAEYEIELRARGDAPLTSDDLRGAVVRLLAAAASSPASGGAGESERRSDSGPRDLRPYIEDVEVLEVDEAARSGRLRMVLRLDPSGAGRPEDVVAALDLPVKPVRRSGPASSSLTLPPSPGRLLAPRVDRRPASPCAAIARGSHRIINLWRTPCTPS